jgi:tRNA G18 (ribose-2'-O)-methylase SpoU
MSTTYFEDVHTPKMSREASYGNSKLPFNVMALTVNSCLNTGNMIRSANINGVHRFFLFGKRNYDKRSAMTLYNHVDVIRVSKEIPQGLKECDANRTAIDKMTKTHLEKEDYDFDSELFIQIMNQYHMTPIFIEQSRQSILLHKINWKYQLGQIPAGREICLIMGNEKYGVPRNILATQKRFEGSFSLEIPQTGIIASYNVSNCAAIIMNGIFNHYSKKLHDDYNLF